MATKQTIFPLPHYTYLLNKEMGQIVPANAQSQGPVGLGMETFVNVEPANLEKTGNNSNSVLYVISILLL